MTLILHRGAQEASREEIGEILIEGANKAQKIAKTTMEEVREKIGVR